LIIGKIIDKINSVLDTLKYNPKATIPDLIEVTGKGQRTISRELKEHQDAELLRCEGSRKTGYWVVE
jgi:predicted HTH transcriptional regulator